MLNSIGLQNPGVDAVIEKYAETWATWKTPVLVNVAGESVHDYVEVARRLDGVPGVAGIELNISCPNVGAGGLQFAIDAGAAGRGDRRRPAGDRPAAAGQAVAERRRHPADRAGHRRRRRRRADRDQHAVRDRRRAGARPAAARQHLRRAERAGGQAGRAAGRLRGGPGRAGSRSSPSAASPSWPTSSTSWPSARSRSRSGPRSSPTRRCRSGSSTSWPESAGARGLTSYRDLIGTALPAKAGTAVGQGRRVPALARRPAHGMVCACSVNGPRSCSRPSSSLA